MDIPAAIDLQKTALQRIIAGLFAMLGAAGARIPLSLHRDIARELRPAESAVRRLIVTLAIITKLKAPPQRSPRPAPTGLVRAPRGSRPLAFPLFDPRPRFGRDRKPKGPQPRILSLAPGAVFTPLPRTKPVRDTSDGMEASAHLLRRLAAVKDALENLPRHVKRLARALARREKIPHLQLKTPLRPGRPPGHRKKPRLEIDRILHECHWLARNVVAPNTS